MGRASRVSGRRDGDLCRAAFAVGFVLFALTVTQEPSGSEASADGIVVLTGGEQRILEGARCCA